MVYLRILVNGSCKVIILAINVSKPFLNHLNGIYTRASGIAKHLRKLLFQLNV